MAIADKIAAAKSLAVACAEIVYHYKLIAMSIGYSEDQLKRWREADEHFADQLEQGRARFLTKHIKNAKPEFLLERMEREVFAPPKQEIGATINPIREILKEYGLDPDKRVDDVGKTETP